MAHPDLEHALAERDYPRIVELLSPAPGPHARTLRFARNMIALRARDPHTAGVIENTVTTGRVRITTARDGLESLALAGMRDNHLCPGGEPTLARVHAERVLAELPDPASSIALAGVGDGHVLDRLALEPADVVCRQRAVFVIEPDAELFRSTLLVHDWHAETGPLAQGRVMLFVGEGWRERLIETLTPDARLPPPGKAVRQCADPAPIRDALQAAVGVMSRAASDRRQALARVYAPLTPPAVADRLRSRTARVMLLTTRYSTVLQHSTRDLAEGFARLGCPAHIVIEDEPWQQHLIASLLGEVERFRPDLVVQIDHHRHETPGVFPEQVPFVCIVQDNLPNLLSRDAARKMGPTDFAAGSWIRRYVLEHAYPPHRSIEIPRLARGHPGTPCRASPRDPTPDIIYVSNHSAPPEAAAEQALASTDPAWTAARDILRAASDDLIERYERGGCVEDSTDLDAFVAESCARHGLTPLPPDAMRALGDKVGVTTNNALYRRQGLRWVARAAETLGLTLALYGRGWENNPEFAPFARGVIGYREELPELTARVRFCMVLEPYFPTQHQRALDTWMWGGLALVRRRPRDRAQAEFFRRLAELPDEIDTIEKAVAHLGAASGPFVRAHEAMQGLNAWDGTGDLVALYRARERDGIAHLSELPPRFGEVSFEDEAGLVAVVRSLVDDPDRWRGVARVQREWAIPRFSYEAGAARLLDKVARALPLSSV